MEKKHIHVVLNSSPSPSTPDTAGAGSGAKGAPGRFFFFARQESNRSEYSADDELCVAHVTQTVT